MTSEISPHSGDAERMQDEIIRQMTPGPEEITSRLERAGIDYCIVGGLASIAYGRPRLTLEVWNPLA